MAYGAGLVQGSLSRSWLSSLPSHRTRRPRVIGFPGGIKAERAPMPSTPEARVLHSVPFPSAARGAHVFCSRCRPSPIDSCHQPPLLVGSSQTRPRLFICRAQNIFILVGLPRGKYDFGLFRSFCLLSGAEAPRERSLVRRRVHCVIPPPRTGEREGIARAHNARAH